MKSYVFKINDIYLQYGFDCKNVKIRYPIRLVEFPNFGFLVVDKEG